LGGGSAPTTLATSGPWGDGGYLAVDASSVYWTTLSTVMKVGVNGGSPVTLAAGGNNFQCLAIDGQALYWDDSGAGTILKVPLGGGQVTTLASGESGAAGIAVDATSVYWANSNAGTIKKVTPK
jgi:hypothetical protein